MVSEYVPESKGMSIGCGTKQKIVQGAFTSLSRGGGGGGGGGRG